MRTIKDLKKRIECFNKGCMVIVQSISITNDFLKEYKNWHYFEYDDTINDLELYQGCFFDIHEGCIEIWIK